jgi:hypothetical protein
MDTPILKCEKCGNDDTRKMADNGESPHAPTYQLLCAKCKHFWFVN